MREIVLFLSAAAAAAVPARSPLREWSATLDIVLPEEVPPRSGFLCGGGAMLSFSRRGEPRFVLTVQLGAAECGSQD